MTKTIPPLNGLRAFEAAARHLSFTRAAEELHVTQAAVSHQVKALEDRLGLDLFRRVNRALLLTDAGQTLYPALRDGLETISDGLERATSAGTSGPLTISLLPSMAGRWVMPRLGRFLDAHPEIDVRLQASERLVDFTRDNVDLALRAGKGGWEGLTTWPVAGEWIVPVCSPKLLEGERPLKTPADLIHHTLLHDEMLDITRESLWRIWLKAAGVADRVDSTKGPYFSHTYMALQEAAYGRGVALGQGMIVADDLMAGTLVAPFGPIIDGNFGYWVVAPEGLADRPKILAFRDWIIAEAEATQKAVAAAGVLPG
ncbi:MAG: transcriptional regulator GcvA [Rhodospirillales bacterium]